MKLLLPSVSNKVTLIDCIKSSYSIRIVGWDSNDDVVGKLFVDEFYLVPTYKNMNFQTLIVLLKRQGITHIIPTSDHDLIFFSRYKKKLHQANVEVMISDENVIRIVDDKYLFFTSLKNKYPVIPTYLKYEDLEREKYIVKSRYGSGSQNFHSNLNDSMREMIAQREELIYQPYIKGKEYSVDLYLDKHHKCGAVSVRTRENIEQGESQKTQIIEHPKLSRLAKDIGEELKLFGHIMFQFFETRDNKLFIIECNARIGGASTASMYGGLNSIRWFIEGATAEKIKKEFIKEREFITQYRYKRDLIF